MDDLQAFLGVVQEICDEMIQAYNRLDEGIKEYTALAIGGRIVDGQVYGGVATVVPGSDPPELDATHALTGADLKAVIGTLAALKAGMTIEHQENIYQAARRLPRR